VLPEETAQAVAAPHHPLPIERAAAALEVLLCSGFPTQLVIITVLSTAGLHPQLPDGRLSAPFIFTLSLLDTALLVGLIVFFMRAHRESFREALFGTRPIVRDSLLGIALIPVSFMLVLVLLTALQLVAPGLRNVPHNPLQDVMRTPVQAILFAGVVTIAGGVREEIQRGFVLRRFEQYLGGGVVGLVVFSATFGLGHLEQGYDVALATATLGAFWGAVFLVRRSIAAPMVAHAGFDLAQVAKFLIVG
jgi:CAAX protease family protein